ncbi:MAG TPA: protein kinase [Pirellulales bacterium]|nr:protein kinase [Pirellulales bacterium]
MAISVEQFSRQVVETQLVDETNLKEAVDALSAAERESTDALVARLIAAGRLTKFQATQVLAGKARALVLGEYVIQSQLGAGGMGAVYRAVHRRMQRLVALKVIGAAALKDATAVKRFQREVVAAARLSHPNIVTAHDASQAGAVHYLVMEYVEGQDLSNMVKTQGPLPVERAIGYIRQAAAGLAYAHSKGVIHRDIKPANLLVDNAGVVKILDMGLARFEGAGEALTATEAVMGTVDYMSPEQATDTHSADARSDIYSLGCSLWYLLTGRRTYDGDSLVMRIMRHREAPLPSLVEARPEVSESLNQVFQRMVAKKPEDRLQTMDEVVAALDGCLAGSSTNIRMGEGSSTAVLDRPLGKTVDEGLSEMMQYQLQRALDFPGETIDLKLRGDSTQSRLRINTSGGGRPPRNTGKWLAAAGAAGFLIVLFGIWIVVRDREGNEIVRVEASKGTKVVPPPGGTIEVVNEPDGKEGGKAKGAAAAASPSPQPSPVKGEGAGNLLTSPDFAWSEPEKVVGPILNSPCLSGDGLTVVAVGYAAAKNESGANHNDLWIRDRKSLEEPFGKGVSLGPEVNSDAEETHPWLSADGLTLLFSTNRAAGRSDLWQATRKSRSEPFGPAASLGEPVNSTTGGRYGGALSADGLVLIFGSSNKGSLGGQDLWQSRRKDRQSPFSEPEHLGPAVNSSLEEHRPWLSSDGRVLLFDTSENAPPDETGKRKRVAGSGTLWMASRPSVDAPFGARQKLPAPINAIDSDNTFPSATADGKLLFFTSKRDDVTSDYAALWMSRRVPQGSGQPAEGSGQLAASSLQSPAARPQSPAPSAAANYELDLSTVVDDKTLAHVELPARPMNASVTVEMFARPRSREKMNRNLFYVHRGVSLRSYDDRWVWIVSMNDTAKFSPVAVGQRVHLAGVLDANTKALRLYVDGKLVDSVTSSAALPATEIKSQLGTHVPSETFARYDGTIDEVRISDGVRYTKDFTPQERLEPDAQTWALYHCDENGGDKLVDASGKGHHGTIVGATWTLAPGDSRPAAYAGGRAAQTPGDSPGANVASPADLLTSPDYTWSEPEKVASGNGSCISGDGLTLVIASGDSTTAKGSLGFNDLWLLERSSLDKPFGKPVNLGANVNSTEQDSHPWLSADGLTVLFSSSRAGGLGGNSDLYLATRKSRSEPFGPAVSLGEPVNSKASEHSGALSANGLAIIFASDRGTKNSDLWQSRRKDLRSPFGEPKRLNKGDNDHYDERPWLSTDGRALMFTTFEAEHDKSKKRVHVEGSGVVRMQTRPTADAAFGPWQNIPPPINIPGSESFFASATADGKLLFFNSTRDGGPYAIWMSRRVPIGSANNALLPSGEGGRRPDGGAVAGAASPHPNPLPKGEGAGKASPFDSLKRSNIPADQLKRAGMGDPAKAPADIVAIVGATKENPWTSATSRVAINPVGRNFALSVGSAKGVTFWQKESGKLGIPIADLPDRVNRLAFSPYGKLLAAGLSGDAKTILVFDVTDAGKKEKFTLTGHTAGVWALAFSPDGKTLVSGAAYGTADTTVRLWDTATGKQRLLITRKDAVLAVAFSPDGKTLATDSGETDRTIRFYDPATGVETGTPIDTRGPQTAMVYSPDGRTLAAGSSAGTVQLYDVATGKLKIGGVKIGDLKCLSMAYRPDGRLIAIACNDGAVRFLDASSLSEIKTLQLGPPDGLIDELAFDGTGRYLLTANGNQTAYVLRLEGSGRLEAGGERRATAGSSPAPSPQPLVPAKITTPRELAEWVIGMGGFVTIGDAKRIRRIDDLPEKIVAVLAVGLPESPAVDDALVAQMVTWPLLPANVVVTGAEITDAAVRTLAGRFQGMQALSASETSITGEGFDAFKGKAIGYLNLSGCRLSAKGFAAICDLKTINKLLLGGCPLKADDLADLSRHTELVELHLDYSKITDAGLRHLEPLTALTTLTLTGTQVSAAGVAKLQKALPKCKIEWGEAAK